MTERALGKRFSHIYRDRSVLIQDSAKMRFRLSQACLGSWSRDYPSRRLNFIAEEIQREVGIPAHFNLSSYVTKFFSEIAYDDLLDVVTVIYNALEKSTFGYPPDSWRDSVRRIFKEECIALTVDDRGGVHFAVDEEFAVLRQAVLSGLGGARYRAVNSFFLDAYAALDNSPADTRQAVRLTYEAIENLFKIMLDGKAARLGKAEIDRHLKPLLSNLYKNHDLTAAKLMLTSLGEWVNGMQQYRHAPGHPDPAGPPVDLAVMIISSGSSYLRWLLHLDQALNPSAE